MSHSLSPLDKPVPECVMVEIREFYCDAVDTLRPLWNLQHYPTLLRFATTRRRMETLKTLLRLLQFFPNIPGSDLPCFTTAAVKAHRAYGPGGYAPNRELLNKCLREFLADNPQFTQYCRKHIDSEEKSV